MSARTTVVVPTLGASPWLEASLRALRDHGSGELEVALVVQGAARCDGAAALADRTWRLAGNRGFAAACNLAIGKTRGDWVALVNDDAVVEPGWHAALLDAMHRSGAAAAQGVNLLREAPDQADGCGLTWNRSWQAVQIGRGLPAPEAGLDPVAVFGVSATAALYRRSALDRVAFPNGDVLDSRLFAYYEDVDLACRLRAAGLEALGVPAARAVHAGSVTGRTLPLGGRHYVYGNRYLVLARFLGSRFWSELPRAWIRDVADLARGLGRGDVTSSAGVLAGWLRALRLLPWFARRGAPGVPLAALRRDEGPS